MRQKIKSALLLAVFGILTTGAFAQEKKVDISIFPEAKEGYKKVVLNVPKKGKEDNLQLEIFVGKYVEVDMCNNHFLIGEFKDKELKSWGYTYYEYKTKGDVGGTMMACPDNKKQTKFVNGKGEIIRYNSKVPVVVYVPNGMEVKYRVWKTKAKLNTVK